METITVTICAYDSYCSVYDYSTNLKEGFHRIHISKEKYNEWKKVKESYDKMQEEMHSYWNV